MTRCFHTKACLECGRDIKHFPFGATPAHKCPHGERCATYMGGYAPKCYKCLLAHPNREKLQKFKDVTLMLMPTGGYDVITPDNQELMGPLTREEAENAAQCWLAKHGTGVEQVVWTEYKPDGK